MTASAEFFAKKYSRTDLPVSRPGVTLREGEISASKTVPCRLCGSENAEPATAFPPSKLHGWKIVRCCECDLLYTQNQIPPELWSTLYPSQYPPHVPAKPRWSAGLRTLRERFILRFLSDVTDKNVLRRAGRRLFKTWVDPMLFAVRGSGRLLDVGCGCGTYLAKMSRLGWQVAGVDRSEEACRVASKCYGVQASAGAFPDMEVEGKFDLITAWQVVEHLEEPIPALARMRTLLADGGRIVVAVPNIESWAAAHFGPHWIGLDLPRHLSHFSFATLEKLLNAAGLNVVHQQTCAQGSWIRHSARRAKQKDAGWHRAIFAKRAASRVASFSSEWFNCADSLMVVCTPA